MKPAQRKTSAKVWGVLALLSALASYSVAEVPAEGKVGNAAVQRVFPIDASHRNSFTRIRNRIFTDPDFEMAILRTTEFGQIYEAVVVIMGRAGLRCEIRRLDVATARTPAGKLDPTKLAVIQVVVKSREISEEAVRLLADGMREQVLKADYLNQGDKPRVLDGADYEVYVGSACALVEPPYMARFSSTDTIFAALAGHVSHPEQDRPTLLEQVVAFFRDRKAGKNPPDEWPTKPPIPMEEIDMPPP